MRSVCLCWEGLGAGGKGHDREWDGWMASLTRWAWVWVNSGSWWWKGRPGVLWFMGSQRVGHGWVTELNWTELCAHWEALLIFKWILPLMERRGLWTLIEFSSVQSISCVRLLATPWTTARQSSLSITNSQSWPKFMSIELVMPPYHLILCCPLLLLPSIFPSITVFSNKSVLPIRWPKNWSFSISPSNEYSGLISFRINWFVLLAVQGTLNSLLQHHQFFGTQLSL